MPLAEADVCARGRVVMGGRGGRGWRRGENEWSRKRKLVNARTENRSRRSLVADINERFS